MLLLFFFQDLHPIYLFLFLLVSVIFLKALVCLNSAMIAGSKQLSNLCIWSVRTLGVFSSVVVQVCSPLPHSPLNLRFLVLWLS